MLSRIKTETMIAICILLFSSLIVLVPIRTVKAQGDGASFTGTFYDYGVDTDGDGEFDYLAVTFGINVSTPGNVRIEAYQLVDEFGSYIFDYASNETFVGTPGNYDLTLDFDGATINRARLNPMNISEVRLIFEYNYPPAQTLTNVELSRIYSYTEFETSPYLTRNVTDRGVDTDGDGLFNYLEVGVEFNATEATEYEIQASGVLDTVDSGNPVFYQYATVDDNFSIGVHTVLLNFSGPGIAADRINVTAIYSVSLYAMLSDYFQNVDSTYSIPLSTTYWYYLFNSPSKETKLNFTVYPDGSIGVDLLSNATYMYPENYGPFVNGTFGFSRNGNVITGSAMGTLNIPSSMSSPLNSTEGHEQVTYQNGIFNQTMSETVFLPPEAQIFPYNTTDLVFNSTYSDEALTAELSGQTILPSFYTSMFPFNSSDATVMADWNGNILNGNVTFHVVSGFPLTDVRVDFTGNRTNIQLMGNVNVTYSSFGGMEINSTVLDDLIANLTSALPGQGANSLYNMTSGLLEVTELNLTKIPFGMPEAGADVEYSVTIDGNFTGLIAKLAQAQLSYMLGTSDEAYQGIYAAVDSALSSVQQGSVVLNYYHVSGMADFDVSLRSDVATFWSNLSESVLLAFPVESRTQIKAILEIANATSYAITESTNIMSMSSSELKMTMYSSALLNVAQLKKDVMPFLPDLVSPNMHDSFESFLNQQYVTLDSLNLTLDIMDLTESFNAQWVIEGDLQSEINGAVQLYITAVNATYPWELPPELRLLNETGMNIDNLQAQIIIGKDSQFFNVTGLIVKPPVDELNFIKFRLYQWFARLADYEASTGEIDKLTVTVVGGMNETDIVLLDPELLVSSPDSMALNYTSMGWNDATFNNVGYLEFLVAYLGKVNFGDRTYYVPIYTNSTVSNVGFNGIDHTLSFDVSGESGTGFCNVTIPMNFINATTGPWRVKLDGTYLDPSNFTVVYNGEYTFVFLNYTHSAHTIEIQGLASVAEYPPNLLPPVLLVLAVIAAGIAITQRRKIARLKTKYQNSLNAFIAQLRR